MPNDRPSAALAPALSQQGEQALLAAAFQHARDPTVLLDRSSRILTVNAAFRRALSLGERELTWARFIDFVHPEDHGKTDDVLARLVAAEEPRLELDLRFVAAGEPLAATTEFAALDPADPDTPIVVELRESSAGQSPRRGASDAGADVDSYLQTQILQTEKMASIGQLAAGVAHEINNPLGYVYSNITTLSDYIRDLLRITAACEEAMAPQAEATARQGWHTVRDAVDLDYLREDILALVAESQEGIQRVKKIVQDLKDFSHQDAGDEWLPADLNAGLESTLNIVRNEIKYKATVEKNLAELPRIECVLSQINQVLMNILMNAAQAIKEKGVIRIASGVQGDHVWIEIADTGCGIAADHLSRIFDPFFTTKPVGVGTGLGLSLSYGIVQRHGGRIEVESEVGVGSTFRIWLPVRRPADAPGNRP